ncbi:MAG TPA: carbohydrate kinase family protein, partial [Phototrophicaceae bacterium]|nr:carbohydrate kinase family protein [Phototrophicaceae bacterium]
MTIEHVAFGIVIDDIVMPDGQQHLGVLGGGGPQTAWGMAAALQSTDEDTQTVGLVALVGEDLTPEMLISMTNAGINLDGLRLMADGALTPRAWQEIDAHGGRTHVWKVPPPPPEVHFPSDWTRMPESYQQARNFHWGLHPENPGSGFGQTLTQAGRNVSLETFKPPDVPLTDDELHDLLTCCKVFSPNWGEATGITGQSDYDGVIRRFRDCGGKILALRRGEQGADVWDLERGRGVRVPAVKTMVVDTVGAGNAFCGALLVTLDRVGDLATAAAHGVTAAAYLVEQVGLPLTLPAAEDYERRLASIMAQ